MSEFAEICTTFLFSALKVGKFPSQQNETDPFLTTLLVLGTYIVTIIEGGVDDIQDFRASLKYSHLTLTDYKFSKLVIAVVI